ncbi:MAG TPA: choice-of-anchor D domain-containing protein, partial [Terriglobia bacterium]|nr:choice-of-anchor D domain-containing protein [Terriglobia bacterium]
FPTTLSAFQPACQTESSVVCAGGSKAFVTQINPADAPGVAISSPEVNFGDQTVGTASPLHAVTLRNVGSQPLVIRRIFAVSTRYFTQTNDCGASLDPGAACTIGLTFTPAAPGRVIGFLVLSDNASPKGLQFIRLVGSGA